MDTKSSPSTDVEAGSWITSADTTSKVKSQTNVMLSEDTTKSKLDNKPEHDKKEEADPETSPMKTEKPCCPCWATCSQKANSACFWVFFRWGLIVAFHPIKVMVISLLVAIALIPLWQIFQTQETAAERLWAPQASRGVTDQILFTADYGSTVRRQQIIITRTNPGGNMLELEVMKEVLRFDEMFRNTTIEYEEELTGTGLEKTSVTGTNKTLLGFQDMCVKTCSDSSIPFCNDCRLIGHPLEFWFRADRLGGGGDFDFSGTYPDDNRTACTFQGNRENKCSISARVQSGYSISASEQDWNDPDMKISLAGMYAGLGYNNDGALIKAEAIMYAYLLNEYPTDGPVTDTDKHPQLLLETEWENKVDSFKSDLISVEFQSNRAIGDALSAAIGPDLIILNMGFLAIILYTMFVLGDFHPVRCRSVLALCGVISVGAAILACFGVASATGFFFSPVTNVLPFILIGIGVDDMFVIVHGYDNTNEKDAIEHRFATAMGHVGVSITITSLTDILAFVLGCTSSLPGILNFCAFAAWGIFIDYLLQITFFAGALVLDARRQDKGYGDCCRLCLCCGRCKVENHCCEKNYQKCPKKISEKGVLHYILDLYATNVLPKVWFKVVSMILMVILTVLGGLGASQIKQDFSRRFFVPQNDPLWNFFGLQDEYFGDVGLPVSIMTGDANYSTLAAQKDMREMLHNINNCNKEGKQCSGDWIIPGTVDSWHSAFIAWANTCGVDVVDKVCYPPEAVCSDTFSAEEAEKWAPGSNLQSCDDIKSLCGLIPPTANPCRKTCGLCVVSNTDNASAPTASNDLSRYSGPLNKWDCEYTAGPGPTKSPNECYGIVLNADNYTVPPMYFNEWLFRFLNDTRAGGRYKSSVTFEDPANPVQSGIRTTRSRATYAAVYSAQEEIDSMRDLRVVTDKGHQNLGYCYPYFFGFIFYEQYAIIIFEGIQNLVLALAAVFLICFALLTHLGATMIVLLAIVMIDIEIVGLMYAWSVPIDSVSVTNLVLAVGLAVDYSVHLAHAFLLAPGQSRNARARTAILEMGVPVLHGAISTFLAVMLLSAAGSYIFQVFFKMFFAICVFGVLNGLVFLPVLFSMIGPKPISVTLPEIPDQFAQKLFKSKEKQVSNGTTEDGNTKGDVELVVQTALPTISMQSPVPGIAAGPQSQHEISKSMPETIQNKAGDE